MLIPAAAPVKLTAFSVMLSTTALVALEFSPSEITAITIAVTALLAAVFTGIVNIIVALRTVRKVDENTEITAKTATELTKVSEKTNAIGDNVDGLKTRADAEMIALRNEKAALQQQLIDAEKRAVALAGQRTQSATPPMSADVAVDTLRSINQDTTAIEKNTAATETKVDALKEQK